LDAQYAQWFQTEKRIEKSVILFGSMEAMLTPLMEAIEAQHPLIKVFSLPSVDHPKWGRHIELGVKGPPEKVDQAFQDLKSGLEPFQLQFGPEMVR
jgi:molybdopterin-biosynthesis enzyme MoeA-like protein